jgi:hypothetical protein
MKLWSDIYQKAQHLREKTSGAIKIFGIEDIQGHRESSLSHEHKEEI